ncbi:hydantoinase/oxoprolinase family protein, partial [Listeria monocytogenes]|nr:hydantoinase/oxoprolinase family protein [Listeria monocytogenes]
MYKIGIDVGGTNTDAVILDHQLNLIHSVKVPTTDDIQTGIAGALNKVLAESAVD